MIDAALADKFIKKVANYTEYNINVMNENGMIIASLDSSRIGSFHEVAYDIMSTDKDIVEVVSEDQFQGGRTGINMALIHKKKKIGVVGVSGEPEEIRNTALLIKMALETMLEYEIQNKKHYQRQNLHTRFIDGLLYQEEADRDGELSVVSEQLGYEVSLMRIPILIIFDRQEDAYKLLETIKSKMILSLQDIAAVTRNNNIIIFKSFREKEEILGEYKYTLEEILDKLENCFKQQQVSCRYYVGSFQEKYCFYRKSFQHCIWLKDYLKNQTQQINYFYDYVGEYMRDIVPMIELNRIFTSICELLDKETIASMIEMIETMHRNNYNLNESSRELFIHKNTLIFRYNKIKNLFHVNPIQSMADREFFKLDGTVSEKEPIRQEEKSMKIVFAPDSFRDSMPASAVAEILQKKAEEFFPGCEMKSVPLADGDTGTLKTLVSILKGNYFMSVAQDYSGEPVDVKYGVIGGDTMIIETAGLLQDNGRMDCSVRQKILFSSSYGVGEMIISGLNQGYRKFYIGVGTSISNDGGMGCAQALGVSFYDEQDRELEGNGINLLEIARIDDSGLDPRLREAKITVMCAVNNVLTGYEGATYVYGARNGAGPDELLRLEKGMRHYAKLLEEKTGIPISNAAGTGAAGGLPASLRAFCKVKLTSGISTVLKLIDFESIVEGANLVIVGEGTLDQNTIFGKAIAGIGMMCRAKGIPVVAIVGQIEKGAEEIYHYGISSIVSAVNTMMDEEYAIENAEELLGSAAERMFRLLISGMQMQMKENCLSKSSNYLYSDEEERYRLHWAVDPDRGEL